MAVNVLICPGFIKKFTSMTTKTQLLACFLAACFFSSLSAQNYDVYVSDAGNFNQPPWQILKFDANGQNGQVFISDHLAWPQDILFLEAENTVLITNLSNGRISKFNAATGAFTGEFATGIGGPTRMKIGPDSLLYVLQWVGNGKVWRYRLDGAFVDEFTAVGVPASIGLAWDAAGNLYVSSYNGKYIRRFSPAGADLGIFISSNLAGPTNIWFDDNGDLLVFDYNAGVVKRFDSTGKYLGVFITGVPQCEGVDFLPDGNIIIGSGGTSSVRIYTATGAFVKNFVAPATLGLKTPNAVVLRPTPVSSTRVAYKEAVLVTPSVGAYFRITGPDVLQPDSTFEVYNPAGILIRKINFANGAGWDASGLPDGVYLILAKLPDGSVAGQKVVVQK